MGADRLKSIKDNAERGWNKAGERLVNPSQLSLFDAHPTFARRSFQISLKSKLAACSIGDELLLHLRDSSLVVTRGPAVVGECKQLPASIADELKVGGVLCIEILKIGTLTDTIEVAPK